MANGYDQVSREEGVLTSEYSNIVCEILTADHEVEFYCTERVRHLRHSRQAVETDVRKRLEATRNPGVNLWHLPFAPRTEEVAASLGLRCEPAPLPLLSDTPAYTPPATEYRKVGA